MPKQILKPVGHRVLVLPDKVEEVSQGGIVLARSHVEREQSGTERGTVLALGPDAFYDKQSRWAEEGDRVYFARYAGKEMPGDDYGYPGQPLRIINDEDILGLIAAEPAEMAA